MSFFGDTCHLNRIFGNRSIKSQIWIGFAIVLAILIFMSLGALRVFSQLNKGIDEVTEKVQPVVITAQALKIELEASSQALGFYLLTKNDSYKESIDRRLETSVKLANELASYEFVSSNDIYRERIEEVQRNLLKLEEYKLQLIELATDDLKNTPAQLIATEELNPIAQILQGTVGQMILSDYDEDNVDGERDEYRQTIYDLRYYYVRLTSEFRTYLAFRSSESVSNMAAIRDVISSKLKALQEAEDLHTFEQSDAIPAIIEANRKYFLALDKTIAVQSSDQYRQDIYLIKTEIGPLVSEILTELGGLVEELRTAIAETSSGLRIQATNASNTILVGMVLGVVIGIIISFVMARMMSIPINAAVTAMEDLADGEGDLTHRLKGDGNREIAQMASGFNRFAGKVQTLVSEVAGSIDNLSTVVGKVSGIVDQTQRGSEQQRRQTGHVASAITQMASSVQEVAANANSAADSAHQADEVARSGQKIVGETISSINSLASEIENSVNVVDKLSEDVESIGTVLDVIKSIAEQTNLLALNAAIEAARAGEQGRGFSVVADEVRTLASRTQDSTKEIEEMIGQLHSQVGTAVETISKGQGKAKASVANASNAGKALEDIASSVSTISNMILQIASASEQQSAVAGEINQNVADISRVADENAEASNELASSSENLARLAAELQEQVSLFKY